MNAVIEHERDLLIVLNGIEMKWKEVSLAAEELLIVLNGIEMYIQSEFNSELQRF